MDHRSGPALIATLAVLGSLALVPLLTVAVPPADGAAALSGDRPFGDPDAATQAAASANASDLAPGTQLAGVVGVGEAEVEAAVDERAFGIQVRQATSNETRAAIVADRFGTLSAELEELERTRDDLLEARAANAISEGEFRARAAAIAARSRSLEGALATTGTVAEGLPAPVLESRGIAVASIRSLADRAGAVAGQEMAAIAREIAGPGVGGPPGGVPADGPPGDGASGGASAAADDGGTSQGAGGADVGPGGQSPRTDGAITNGTDSDRFDGRSAVPS